MALPVVAIIGRPNVGKSSLLNALAGKRISIVEPSAGVTRDRVSTIIARDDHYFELVDTGGYGIIDSDQLGSHIEQQIQKAIESALRLTDQFIADYKKANRNIKKLVEVKPINIESRIVSSKNSKVFHRAGCSAAKRIKTENVTNFKTAGDAFRAGLRPCKICGKSN